MREPQAGIRQPGAQVHIPFRNTAHCSHWPYTLPEHPTSPSRYGNQSTGAWVRTADTALAQRLRAGPLRDHPPCAPWSARTLWPGAHERAAKPPPVAAAFLVFLQGEDFRGAALIPVLTGTASIPLRRFLFVETISKKNCRIACVPTKGQPLVKVGLDSMCEAADSAPDGPPTAQGERDCFVPTVRRPSARSHLRFRSNAELVLQHRQQRLQLEGRDLAAVLLPLLFLVAQELTRLPGGLGEYELRVQ